MHHPIIYVRGYAMTASEIEETVATPYMGFNQGSTKVRQRWDRSIQRHVFESPLVRLMKDYKYRDIYTHGEVLAADVEMPERSVIIYRYYEQASQDLGDGHRPDIDVFARGLSDLIARTKEQVCRSGDVKPEDFRVYLVAHSMGGLICRAFLQNDAFGEQASRDCVDKVFTYATPHNGIDVKLLGNVPSFLSMNNASNFNRDEMRGFLAIEGGGDRADSLGDRFPAEKFFSLVGTNAKDYQVASGWSTRAIGQMSDGLVRISNAAAKNTPRAFVHRSHSGHYGIVNSEEGYQNLTRFLFGDVRVDGKLVIEDIRLPHRVEKARLAGKEVRASYHFESVVRPRGARYDLHRRLVSENSAIFRSYDEIVAGRHPHLFSIFLDGKQRTRPGRGPLVFAIDLGVKVPEYEIERFSIIPDIHIEGAYIFRETIIIAAIPPKRGETGWTIRYGTNPTASNPTPREAKVVELPEQSASGAAGVPSLKFTIPIKTGGRPGIDATLELTARPWS
jgi:hypothetical protein